MKSMPASSAMMASFLLSGQLPDQRSGTSVTARPDEQFGPNRPICNLLPEYIDRRAAREASWAETCGACTVSPFIDSPPPCGEGLGWVSRGHRLASTPAYCLSTPHPTLLHKGGGKKKICGKNHGALSAARTRATT